MSCKVFLPDDSAPASPVPWKQVPGGAPRARPQASPAPDPAARAARIEQECEQRVREAYAAGLREGETAGRNRAAAEFQPVVERFSQTVAELAQLRGRLRREAESDTVKLALAIARRILRRELAVDPDALGSLLIGAMEKLQAQEISRVRIHPSHLGTIQACLASAYGGARVEVVPDGSRPPGTAIFETARGNLDASVDSQLEEIERGLTDCLQHYS